MAQTTEIWTERLFLRGAESRDLRYYRKWFCDPEAMKFWSTPPHTTIEQTQKFVDSMIASPNNGVMDFSVCLADSSVATVTEDAPAGCCCENEEESYIVIGKAGLYDGKEIGFIFDREYWGKGYAFEALDAILRHVWSLEDNAPEVITADVDPRNAASLRLLTKLGFVEVGSAKNTFETHLGWCDSVYLEVKKPLEIEDA